MTHMLSIDGAASVPCHEPTPEGYLYRFDLFDGRSVVLQNVMLQWKTAHESRWSGDMPASFTKLVEEIELAREAVIALPQVEPWPRPFEIHSTPRT